MPGGVVTCGADVFIPLMPEGVEHTERDVPQTSPCCVFIPLMPEGVEH